MKTVIEMARQAWEETGEGWTVPAWFVEREKAFERFAELVRADEREACEVLYTHEDVQAPVGNSAWGEAYQDGWIAGAQAYRDAIRARSNT